MVARLINRLWLWGQRAEHRKFWHGAPRFLAGQHQLLQTYLRQNERSLYGKNHQFATLSDYRNYAERVPVIEHWAQMEPYVAQAMQGTQQILTVEAPVGFEETSGTEGFSKCIPYTTTLKREFERAVAVWMTSLSQTCPQAFGGKSYWSISPALKEKRYTPSGLPIGLEDDTDYFHPITAWFLRQVLVRPPVGNLRAHEAFYGQTVETLLNAADQLCFISAWSPVFLLQLDDYLQKKHPGSTWRMLFPRLACVSCWQDAQASVWMSALHPCLGDVPIQGKGLLATEGVTTIPIGFQNKQVLAWRSHFFEFRDADTEKIGDASILREGGDYEVILTTGGGLYRYATRDLVRCEGTFQHLPLLRFKGRMGRVSDLTGEKLSEAQVVGALQHSGFTKAFQQTFVYAEQLAPKAGYVVLTYGQIAPYFDAEAALSRLEQVLCQNPYYAQARNADQLTAARWQPATQNPLAAIQAKMRVEQKIKEGDMKIPVLIAGPP